MYSAYWSLVVADRIIYALISITIGIFLISCNFSVEFVHVSIYPAPAIMNDR